MREWNIGGMMIDSENPKYLERNLPSVTLSTKNSAWTALELNPGLHGEKLVTNLRYAKIWNII